MTRTVLDEIVPYLDGPELEPGQMENYFLPERSAQSGSLFDHCAAALDRSLEVGAHGLPLMGSGDWNDGMNRVGHEGRGESVWLGWFLHIALAAFAPIAEARGDHARAQRWRTHMVELATGAWNCTGGTATGTAVPISTTAPRSARP